MDYFILYYWVQKNDCEQMWKCIKEIIRIMIKPMALKNPYGVDISFNKNTPYKTKQIH